MCYRAFVVNALIQYVALSMKAQVSRRAIEARVHRALGNEGQLLFKTRGGRALQQLGEYYVVDIDKNIVKKHHCSLKGMAKDLNCIAGHEVMDS